jgi:uncharacterized flavoprotein (TIGR03862 family)
MDNPITPSRRVAVIGGGPAGLMVAETLAAAGVSVTVFEQMPSVGRKLLLAGRGGLNLTHSESLELFLARYGPAREVLAGAIRAFGPDDLRAWSAGLGQEPFVGSSGRVFPSGFRATPLLRAWLRRLDALGVDLRVRQRWIGWADSSDNSGDNSGDDSGGSGAILVADPAGVVSRWPADAVVLALGGASWPRTGSDGAWVAPLEAEHIRVTPLRPANSGFDVAWTEPFRSRFPGTPLKNVTLSFGPSSARGQIRGEIMITATGIEGGAVYALGRPLRDALEGGALVDGGGSPVTLTVDLRPDVTGTELLEQLGRRRRHDSTATALRRVGLPPVAVGLLREVTGNQIPVDATELARLIKAVPITLLSVRPLDRAISTAGGIALDEIDETFMLRRRPGTFVAGEMLDWEAPTGGYLLQATFSTAMAAARGVLTWLASDRRSAQLPD